MNWSDLRCLRCHDLNFPRCSLNFIEFHRFSLNFMELQGNHLNFSAFHWISLSVIEFHWLPMSFIEFHWLSLNLIGRHWISSKFTEFHKSFIEFDWLSLNCSCKSSCCYVWMLASAKRCSLFRVWQGVRNTKGEGRPTKRVQRSSKLYRNRE